jgi:hypothetical protein
MSKMQGINAPLSRACRRPCPTALRTMLVSRTFPARIEHCTNRKEGQDYKGNLIPISPGAAFLMSIFEKPTKLRPAVSLALGLSLVATGWAGSSHPVGLQASLQNRAPQTGTFVPPPSGNHSQTHSS